MALPTSLSDLILARMKELGLDHESLGFRLGYLNSSKASGRVYALLDGQITSAKSRRALTRLPELLEVSRAVVEKAIEETEQVLADIEQQAEEQRRLARDQAEADWRASFRPHAIIQTKETVPSQITMCGLTGGAERWLTIRFDLTRPSITFVQQALDALPEKAPQKPSGRRFIWFFGRRLG